MRQTDDVSDEVSEGDLLAADQTHFTSDAFQMSSKDDLLLPWLISLEAVSKKKTQVKTNSIPRLWWVSLQQFFCRFPNYHLLCSRAEKKKHNPGIHPEELDQAGGSAGRSLLRHGLQKDDVHAGRVQVSAWKMSL